MSLVDTDTKPAKPLHLVTPDISFGTVLNDLMAIHQLTGAELARRTGYGNSQISKWRRGTVLITEPVMLKLLKAVGYQMALILQSDT